jgi:hypothetical protein
MYTVRLAEALVSHQLASAALVLNVVMVGAPPRMVLGQLTLSDADPAVVVTGTVIIEPVILAFWAGAVLCGNDLHQYRCAVNNSSETGRINNVE